MNKKIIVIFLMVIALIVFIILTVNKTTNKTENIPDISNTPFTTSTNETFSSEVTASSEKEVILEDFDSSYTSSVRYGNEMIVIDNKAFYLIKDKLYCYDLNETNIVFSHEIDFWGASDEGIYQKDGYIYYADKDGIKKVDRTTFIINEVVSTKDIFLQICNDPNSYREENYFIEKLLVYKNIIITQIVCYENSLGEPVSFLGIGRLEELEFKNIIPETYFIDMPVLIDDKAVWSDFNYFDMEDFEAGETLQMTEAFFDISRVITDNKIGEALLISGDYVFTSRWPDSSSTIHGLNINTGEVIYEHKVESSFVDMYALNQYIIYYCFDRMQIEEMNAKEGVVIYDVKNQLEYKDEEINTIISGDITDYMELLHMEYYLDGNIAYALKREQNLVTHISDVENYVPPEIFDEYLEILEGGNSIYKTKAFDNLASGIKLYRVEIIEGEINFTLLYKDYD